MADYSELKRLAEAFPADLDWDSNTEPFFNGPSGESLGGGATGFYTVYGKPFRLEDEDYDYDGPTYVESCPADFAKFMVAARDGVLGLIAENEQDEMHLRAFRSVAETAIAERDQLKAENAGLKTGYEAYELVNAELKAENEALRNSLDALTQLREELIAQGRNFALDEASHLCFRTAFEKYYPAGTRYKLFTPKIQKAVGDALVEAANLIAELPDGPYQRHAERRAKLAMSKGEQS